MVHGTYTVKRVIERSVCYTCEDYRLDKHDMFKIYSGALMPDIGGGIPPKIINESVDGSMIKNGGSNGSIPCQNYIMAKYVGPLPPADEIDQYADPDYKTPKGTKFILTCDEGNPNVRTFEKEKGVGDL